MQLCEDYPETVLAAALQAALECHCYSVDGVRELVRRIAEPQPPAPFDLQNRPDLAQVQVRPPDIDRFNQLLSSAGAA